MIKSMTGFGAAEGGVGGTRVAVEIRSVNHRFFNPSVKLPPELSRWEGEVRDAMRRNVARGHVTLSARVERTNGGAAKIDEAHFGDYVTQIRDLQQRHGLSPELDAGTVLRLPNVIAAGDETVEGSAHELVAIVEQAFAALNAMRQAE